jgi:hypothetical protein
MLVAIGVFRSDGSPAAVARGNRSVIVKNLLIHSGALRIELTHSPLSQPLDHGQALEAVHKVGVCLLSRFLCTAQLALARIERARLPIRILGELTHQPDRNTVCARHMRLRQAARLLDLALQITDCTRVLFDYSVCLGLLKTRLVQLEILQALHALQAPA